MPMNIRRSQRLRICILTPTQGGEGGEITCYVVRTAMKGTQWLCVLQTPAGCRDTSVAFVMTYYNPECWLADTLPLLFTCNFTHIISSQEKFNGVFPQIYT